MLQTMKMTMMMMITMIMMTMMMIMLIMMTVMRKMMIMTISRKHKHLYDDMLLGPTFFCLLLKSHILDRMGCGIADFGRRGQ